MDEPEAGRDNPPNREGKSTGNRQDPLDHARIRAIYAVLLLIILLAVSSLTGISPHVDLGVFATLMGGLISLLGLGAVIRLVGPK